MKRLISLFLTAVMLGGLLSGCLSKGEKAPVTSPEQINDSGYTVGVPQGASAQSAVEQALPKAKLQYYNRDADAYLAVQQGKIDAFAYDRVMLEFAIANGLTGVTLLDGDIGPAIDIAIGISPKSDIPDLQAQVNAFLAQIKADGTAEDMLHRWVSQADDTMPDIPVPEHPTLTIQVGTTGLVQPFSYYQGDQLTGYDMEMIYRLAYFMNAKVEIRTYDYDGIAPAAENGVIDLICANLNITEERKQSILFSDVTYQSHNALLVRGEEAGQGAAQAAALDRATYGVMTGSTAESYLGNTYPEATVRTYSAIADAFLALSGGKLDYVLTAYTTALNAVRGDPGLEIDQYDVIEESVAMAVAKGNDQLREKLDGVLARFKTDGTLEKVIANWTTQGQDYVVEDLPASDGANGTLRVAIAADREPMCFVMDGRHRGIDCELIERIAYELGMKVEYQNMSFSALTAALVSGKADVIISNMTPTPERAESVDFTDIYFDNPQVLVARKQERGLRYGVIGVVAQDYLEKNYPGASISLYPSADAALLALQSDKVDSIMISRATAMYMMGRDSTLAITKDNVTDEACYIALKQGSGLLASVDWAISQLRAEGTLEEMNRRWSTADPDHYEKVEIPEAEGKNGTIKVALSPDVAPICFLLDGEYAGIDVELVERIAAILDMKVEFTTMDFDALLPALQSGKADLALSDINATADRRRSADFTQAYFENPQVFLAKKASADTGAVGEYTTLSQLSGKTLACLTGGVFDRKVSALVDGVEFAYYNTVADQVNALKNKKVEGMPCDLPVAELVVAQNPGLAILPQPVSDESYGIALPKGSDLTEQLNAVIAKFRADGTMDEIRDNWLGEDESKKVVPELDFSSATQTLRVACDNTTVPMCYAGDDGSAMGYDIEMLSRIAQAIGKKVEFIPVNFDAIIPMVQSGKADVGIGCMVITDERKETVDMTDGYYDGGIAVVVRAVNAAAPAQQGSFWDGLKQSFIRNFVTENRWKLILSGLEVTVLISICAGILGAVLGFVICLARRSKNRLLSMLAAAFIRLIQGTPIVVFLMILYYVIFGAVDIPAVLVAILGFAINFGVYVSEMMRTGLDAVDKGQIEAASALGYNRYQTFWKITFPQAARHFLPVLKGEFIGMVKMTSVVGYIAIQDLTKASDIIRSRTLEAFFPLIATAVIYFLVANVLTMLLSRVEVKLDPKRRKRTVKGVEQR